MQINVTAQYFVYRVYVLLPKLSSVEIKKCFLFRISLSPFFSGHQSVCVSKKKLQKCNCRMISSTVTHVCRWCLVPRVLRDVSTVDLSVSVLGEKLSMPLCVAATAMQRMAHPEGETATAKG